MIRFLRLFIRLRWKLFVGGVRAAASKGTLSSFGTAMNALAWGLGGVLLAVLSFGLSVAAFYNAQALTGDESPSRAAAVLALRVALAALLAALLVMPAVRAGRGSFGKGSGGMTRLLLLPWSRRHLHAVEVAASALDPFVVVMVPGLVVFAVLVAKNVGIIAGLLMIVAVALMIVTLMAWVAMIGIALQLLFRDRRRAELASLVILVTLTGLPVLPAMLQFSGAVKVVQPRVTVVEVSQDGRTDSTAGSTAESKTESTAESGRLAEPGASGQEPVAVEANKNGATSTTDVSVDAGQRRISKSERTLAALEKWADKFPVWLQWLPSESFARAANLLSMRRVAGAVPSLLALAVSAVCCWLLSLHLWDRVIRSPESNKQANAVVLSTARWRTVPGLSPQASVVAFSTARNFLRTVRGKLAVVMTPAMVLFIGFIMKSGEAAMQLGGPIEAVFGNLSSGLISMAVLMSFLNVIPVLGNLFAVDQAGFTLQALSPITDRQLVWGKVTGCFLIFVACVVPSVVLTEMWHRTGLLTVAEALVRGVGAFAAVAAVGVFMSTLFPKPVDLNSLSSKGNPHLVSQLVCMFAVALATLVGSLAGLVGFLLLGGILGRLAGSSVMAVLICLLSYLALKVAAKGLPLRWEEVVMAASGNR